MMVTDGLAQIDLTWILLAVSAWLVLSVPLGMAVGRVLASGSRPQPPMVSEWPIEARGRPLTRAL